LEKPTRTPGKQIPTNNNEKRAVEEHMAMRKEKRRGREKETPAPNNTTYASLWNKSNVFGALSSVHCIRCLVL
jgi:hypothetical protein